MADPHPAIAAWRTAVISRGGPYEFLEPLRRRLSDALIGTERPKNHRGKTAQEIDLLGLTSAYRDMAARRVLRRQV